MKKCRHLQNGLLTKAVYEQHLGPRALGKFSQFLVAVLKPFAHVMGVLNTCFLFYYEQEVHVYIVSLGENFRVSNEVPQDND